MSALMNLSKDWQKWVNTNLEKGVSPINIANSLFKNGWVDAALEIIHNSGQDVNVPMIDLKANKIKLSDKQVSIGFVCYKPFVVQIHNFLRADECKMLINSAEGNFKRSKVVNSEDGSFVQHNARTSHSIGYQRGQEPILETIENRISELINWPVQNGEGIQILRYEDGGEYRPHYDYFAPDKKSSQIVTKSGGQRVGTFLMYLSDVTQGGSTTFPKVNLEVRPKLGSALYFANTDISGQLDELTLHAGLPVTRGVKYLATKWLRLDAYGS